MTETQTDAQIRRLLFGPVRSALRSEEASFLGRVYGRGGLNPRERRSLARIERRVNHASVS